MARDPLSSTTPAEPCTEVFRYVDPLEGFRGYLAFHGTGHRLAAGGLRVQRGLREDTVVALAEAMTLKEQVLGLAVDGAKAGIDYDPKAPSSQFALRRFLRFLRPHLLERLSLGPDMGTTWDGLEAAARHEGIPSVKIAIARAQGLAEDDVLARLALLGASVDGLTLGQRRSGHALAHAGLAAAEVAGVRTRAVRAVVQGFGTLGRGAALSLVRADATVVAVADEHGCVVCPDGLDVTRLLATPHGEPVADAAGLQVQRGAPAAVFHSPADLVVLAACENGMTEDQARVLRASAVAVGANLGLAPAVEARLFSRGIAVVPDLVGGCGGSASMDALFGPPTCPRPEQVLEQVAVKTRTMVRSILASSASQGRTPRDAALALCEANARPASARPYGHEVVARQLADA